MRIEGDIIDEGDAWLYEWLDEVYTTPNEFRSELANHQGKPLTVWIDSYGGDTMAASGIYTALKEHKGGITVKIDSKAMSAAAIVAMAGDRVLMSPTALMMVHNPLTKAQGYASDLRKVADILDIVKETIINAYQLKTGRTRASISTLMDNESYMSAKTAIKEKFADGMLYDDSESKSIEMSFNRSTIINSADDAVRRITEHLNMHREEIQPVLDNMPDLTAQNQHFQSLKIKLSNITGGN